MKRINSTALILSASVLLLASCGKEVIPGRGNAPAIKLTVKGIYNTKSSETVLSDLQSDGFNISAYVTETWKRDVVGNSPDIRPGIYVDPGFYEGLYDETSYPGAGNRLEDVLVTYDSSRDHEAWRITGNDGANYAGHKFSWVSGVTMNFFAYAPVSVNGDREIKKDTTGTNSINADYPFTYAAKATSGVVDASDCDDIVFAFTPHVATFGTDPSRSDYGKTVSGSTDKFDLKFYHALS